MRDELSVPVFFSGTLRQLEKNWSHEVAGRNLPAPKVQRRDNLIRTILCSLVQLQLGGSIVEPGRAPKVHWPLEIAHFAYRHNIAQIHHVDPTCPQHGLNLGPTLGQLWPTRLQLAQLGSNLPFWEQLRPKLKPTWRQNGGFYRPGPIRNPQKSRFHLCFTYLSGIEAAHWANVGHNLARSSHQAPPSCAMLDLHVQSCA